MKDSLLQIPPSMQQEKNRVSTLREQDEAIRALESLGYKAQEAMKAIKKVDDGHKKTCEQLIRHALQILSK